MALTTDAPVPPAVVEEIAGARRLQRRRRRRLRSCRDVSGSPARCVPSSFLSVTGLPRCSRSRSGPTRRSAAGRGADRGPGRGDQLRRSARPHRHVPGRAEAPIGGRLRGRRPGRDGRGGGRRPSPSAIGSWPAPGSAATRSWSRSPSTTSSPLPESLSFEQGAAVPVNYATAYAGIVMMGGLREGDRVLIQAAAGGVGIAATQIARARGAEIFGTASASKHDAIRAQGVDHAIDYRNEDFEDVVNADHRRGGHRHRVRRDRPDQLPQGLPAAATRRPADLLRAQRGPDRRGAEHRGAR